MNGAEALKYIRKQLLLKQKDIAGDGLKDISGLETGKANITPKVARLLADRINEIIKDKGIGYILDFEITTDTFMRGIDTEYNECLVELKDNNSIDNLLRLLEKDKRINRSEYIRQAIELLGKHYYSNLDRIYCLSMFIIENYSDNDILVYAYHQIIRFHYYNGSFKEIIVLYKTIKDRINRCKDFEVVNCLYINVATAYSKIDNYDKSLELLSLVRGSDESIRVKVESLLVTMYLMKGDYIKALNEANRIIDTSINSDYILIARANICLIASHMNDFDLFNSNLKIIKNSRVKVSYTKERIFCGVFNAMARLDIKDVDTLTKCLSLLGLIKFELIEDKLEYVIRNVELFSEAILNTHTKIDGKLFALLYSKNSDINIKDKIYLNTNA